MCFLFDQLNKAIYTYDDMASTSLSKAPDATPYEG